MVCHIQNSSLSYCALFLLFAMEPFLGQLCKSKETFRIEQQMSKLGKESIQFSKEKEKE